MSSCRLYKADQDLEFETIKNAISDKEFTDNVRDLELKTILKITDENDQQLWGLAKYEKPAKTSKIVDGEIIIEFHKRAIQSDFVFFTGNSTHFLSFTNSSQSEYVAQKINEALSVAIGREHILLNCFFPAQIIEDFLIANSHTPRDCHWKNLNIPGIANSRLSGSQINRPSDYNRYNTHGEKKAIMVTLDENDWTLEIHECGSVKFISSVNNSEKLNFIVDKILPLL